MKLGFYFYVVSFIVNPRHSAPKSILHHLCLNGSSVLRKTELNIKCNIQSAPAVANTVFKYKYLLL